MVSTGNLKDEVIAGSVTVGVASFIAVLLRIRARQLRGVPLAKDDYTIIAATVCQVILLYNILLTHLLGVIVGHRRWQRHRLVGNGPRWKNIDMRTATRYGLGYPVQTLSKAELVTFLKVRSTTAVLNSTDAPRSSWYPRSYGQLPYLLSNSQS